MEGYICGQCFLGLERLHRSDSKVAMKRPYSTPRKSPPKRTKFGTPRKPPAPHDVQHSPMKKCINKKGSLTAISNAIANSKYQSAFHHILSRGTPASKAFQKVLSEVIKTEVRRYGKHPNKYPDLKGRGAIENFSWAALLEDFASEMPVFFASVARAMQMKEKER